jgi:hypothetical protein
MQDDPQTGPEHVIDLTAALPPSSADLRTEVEQMVAEVQAATRRLAPLLRDATSLLAQVDHMVCDYATGGGPEEVDDRYWAAVRSTGHDQLFDALQALSAMADAYVVVHDRHQAVAPAGVG